jgi:NAD(P)-dependent dehydrogenase (short-subunit alcohol dehydrogenase family)
MVKNIFSVNDRVIVLTGGMGQLGHQFALSLCDAGAKVAIFDIFIDASKFERYFSLQRKSNQILGIVADITDRKSLEAGLERVNEQWGVPFGLINNAAIDSPPNASTEENGPFEKYPESSFDHVMTVNVKGTVLCCQVIGGQMAKEGRGSIINISSIYGIVSPDQRIYEYRRARGAEFYKPVAYSVSKSALVNFSRYLATYWAGKKVRVNTLTFAGVFNNQDPEFLKEYCSHVPLGRMAAEDEYNGAVQFLLSDASAYMTGANLIIDGGWTAW